MRLSGHRTAKAAGRRVGVAISPRPTSFAPLLFGGRLAEGLRLAGELGFDVVELSLREAGDVDRSSLRRSLDESGLALSGIATAQACLFDGLCLSSEQASVRDATVRHLETLIELAAEFGAAVILGGIRGRLDDDFAKRIAQRAGAVKAISDCARRASGLGVEILVEPINRYETNFVNTTDEAIELIEELGLPSVRLLLDTFHMNIEERSFADTIRRAGSRLGYVHLVDSNRLAPGQGHLPFGSILQALDDIGFNGPMVAEVMPLPDAASAARHTAEFWSAP